MTITAAWLQNVDYAARRDRLVLEALFEEEGLLGYGQLPLTLSGSTLSVNVGTGFMVVRGDDQANQGLYLVHNDATVNVPFSAPGSNSWYVGIIAQVRDPNATGAAGDDVIFTTVTGSAAALPTQPALPDSAGLIGWILVSAGDVVGTDAAVWPERQLGPLMPTGMVMPWAAPTSVGYATMRVPNGWLMCNGQAVSRTTYADLFALLGTTYGAGDGSTTFNVPDLRGRMIIAQDNLGGTSANRVAASAADQTGGTGGSENVTLSTAQMPAHTHGDGSLAAASGGAHTHGFNPNTYPTQSGQPNRGMTVQDAAASSPTQYVTDSGGAHTHDVTGSTGSAGSGSSHSNMPPWMAMQFLIKV